MKTFFAGLAACAIRDTCLAVLTQFVVTGGVAAADADLAAYYNFDDQGPTVAADTSGNKNDGKIHGPVAFVKVGDGYALRLDGKSAYVDCGAHPSLDVEQAGTVMCWFNPDAELQGGLVTRITSGSWRDARLLLSLRSPGGLLVWALADGAKGQFAQFPETKTGAWTHIALTFDERRIIFYRNRQRIHAEDQEITPNLEGVPLLIGRSQGLGPEFFKGLIDEVRVYKRALSEKEIGDDYQQTKLGRVSETVEAVLKAGVDTSEIKFISGSPVTAKQYQMLVDNHFLPTRSEMTDFEMAEKLDLDLAALADVKTAYDAKDAAALERALAGYLRGKMGGMNITPTGKPPRNPRVEDWFKTEIPTRPFKMTIGAKGEEFNFYSTLIAADGGIGVEWLTWIGPLTDAYIETGDPKYVERMLDFTRAFYHRCRPPAARRNDWPWGGGSGPWSMGGAQRASRNYLPYLYRVIGNSPVLTDADRVMFLKTFWEHLDLMGQFAQGRVAWNFGPAHLYGHLVDLAGYFPEFRDCPDWLKTVAQGFVHNMEDCVLDDGGTVERTGYNFAFIGPYLANYDQLKNLGAPMPEQFRRGLEHCCDFTLWVLSPTLEYPLFGSSNLGPMTSIMDWAAKIFPERADFAYALSGGQTGAPPDRVARYLWHTGWLTMRSGWDTNALYLAMNINGSPLESGNDSWDNLLSFGLWANGQPYMTDAGTTASYSEEEYYAWCVKTFSCNTVLVDKKTQEKVTNGGRLASWASLPEATVAARKVVLNQRAGNRAATVRERSQAGTSPLTDIPLPDGRGSVCRGDIENNQLPGFTYVAAVSEAYRRFGVSHRRAVFFVRPNYWLIHDVLTGDGQPHRYHWQGHFQPAEVKVDAATKIVCATPAGGTPLWLVPARPESFTLEQKSGPIITRAADPAVQSPLHPNRQIAPYASLEKADAVEPFAFTVLLCPADARPAMESLPVTEKGVAVADAQAIGVRVRAGERDDLLAVRSDAVRRSRFDSTDQPLVRRRSPDRAGDSTEGLPQPSGDLRSGRVRGRETSAQLPGVLRRYGRELATDAEAAYVRRDGKRMVEAGLVNGRTLEYAGKKLIEVGPDIASVHVRFTDGPPEIHAQGRGEVAVWKPARWFGRDKVTVTVGSSEPLTLTPPQFSTTPEDLGKAIGLPRPLAYKDMVVVSWESSAPSDATIEYESARTTNPEPLTAHRFVLRRLDAGKTYSLRITCRTERGAINKLETSYTHQGP